MRRIGHSWPRGGSRRHTALFYSSEREYVEGVWQFIEPAAMSDSPVLVAVPNLGLQRLRNGLEGALEHVELLDMTELGANPARIIPAIRAAAAADAGRPLHFVGEPLWAGRSEDEVSEALCHEALLNHALSAVSVEILCPYNVSVLDAAVVAGAERTHPWLCDRDGRRRSGTYSTRMLRAGCETPLDPPPPGAISLSFELGDLARVRELVSQQAARAGLTLGQCGDAVLAANELTTNSVRHGGGTGVLRVWHEQGWLICEVNDAGHIRDPLAGRVRPADDSPGGRGLWLVNQVCDLVQIRTGPAGTAVRMQARRRWDAVEAKAPLAAASA